MPEAARVITLTANADINALVLSRARDKYGTPELCMPLGKGEESESHRHLGAGVLFGGAISLADWDHWFGHGEVEMIRVDAEGRGPEALLEALQDQGTCLPMVVERRGEKARIIPFSSNYQPAEGDVLIVARVKAAG